MKTFDQIMELTRTISSPTALDDAEAKGLYDCCSELIGGGTVLEIGCQLGRSSSLISQMAKDGYFDNIHIDPYIEDPEYLIEWIRMMRSIGPFTLHCMKSEEAMYLAPHRIDLLFIDGDHEYESVAFDLKTFGWRVVSNGLLAMHDYGRDSLPGVFRAATEYFDDRWNQVGIFGTLGVWRRN